MAVVDKQARDANLDALQSALDQYLGSEITRVDNETKFLRAVLATTGNGPASFNLLTSSTLIQAEIDDFLLVTG